MNTQRHITAYLHVWWELFRPHTITASLVPPCIGTGYALVRLGWTAFRPDVFVAFFLTILLLQTAANMFNEYYDYTRGLDTKESFGIGGAIVHGQLSARTVKHTGVLSGAVACLFGLYLCFAASWWLLPIGAVCGLTAWLYTGGPRPIAYTPFGELAAGGIMGGIGICTAFFLQSGYVDGRAVMVCVPWLILIGLILSSNNIRDMDNDRENGRKTLVILLGRKRSVVYMALGYLAAFGWIIGLAVTGQVPCWTVCSLAAVIPAWHSLSLFYRYTTPKDLMPAMRRTAQVNTVSGFLFTLGLLTALL